MKDEHLPLNTEYVAGAKRPAIGHGSRVPHRRIECVGSTVGVNVLAVEQLAIDVVLGSSRYVTISLCMLVDYPLRTCRPIECVAHEPWDYCDAFR